MTIKQIKEELKTSTNPIAKSLHKGESFNILFIGFNEGMILKEHKSNVRAKLTVLEGSVIYKEENKALQLNEYDEIEIPIGIIHSVEAIANSLCVLTKGE